MSTVFIVKVISKTRNPIIFITKRILRRESSAITKSSNVSVCFHTKSVDFVFERRNLYPIEFYIENAQPFCLQNSGTLVFQETDRLHQKPVRNVLGGRGC